MKIKLITAALACLLAFAAHALTLSDAKSAGLLGEQADGYLGLVKQNSEAKALMLTVNKKRLAHFKAIAKKNKTSVADVAALAGAKFINETAKGHYIKTSSGTWKKK
ncbi:YdbL family protein [Thalassomonas haliotis]|uniref:YdbL family protein n=1 Tax=Thalassomonas haliotis TaxID=485448 RepID=A0ABY7V8V6_9GAMM|nr:YdbL family protein [Thalassomonas haliotis]WDE10022.1 YdbL family protein [Thalassomonas haliotis]